MCEGVSGGGDASVAAAAARRPARYYRLPLVDTHRDCRSAGVSAKCVRPTRQRVEELFNIFPGGHGFRRVEELRAQRQAPRRELPELFTQVRLQVLLGHD